MRRVFGRDHHETLSTTATLAVSLAAQGKHTEATEIAHEALVNTTRLLGAKHKETLIAAANLAFFLWRCGQKAECEQILRDTQALSRRALGPTHKLTQSIPSRDGRPGRATWMVDLFLRL